MRNKISILKRLDLFSEPVRLRTSRASSTKPTLFYGSWTGFTMSMILVIIVLAYMSITMSEMDKTNADLHFSNTLVNSFLDGYNSYNV